MTVWILVPLDAGLDDFVCLFVCLLLCGWVIGFVFGYLLNEYMFDGVFICFDTDLICYLISVFVCYCLLC